MLFQTHMIFILLNFLCSTEEIVKQSWKDIMIMNPSRVDFNNSASLSKFPRPRRWAGDRWLMFGEWAVFKPAVCVAGQAGIVACANPWGLVRSVQTAARLISSLAPERLSP